MSDDDFQPRLDGLTTRWSLLRQAHASSDASAAEARRILVLRYSPAIRSYVGAILRNDMEADEVSQDAVIRLLRGDFAGADPARGRFRDLLKTAVRNMVRDRWSKEKRRKGVAHDLDRVAAEADTPDDPWTIGWRKRVLDLAWDRLRALDERSSTKPYTLLRLRADYPDDTSDQLAARLSQTLGQPIKPEALRQQLRRARIRFAEFIVAEISDGLPEATPDRIQDELIALGLYTQISDVLPEGWST